MQMIDYLSYNGFINGMCIPAKSSAKFRVFRRFKCLRLLLAFYFALVTLLSGRY